MDIPYFGHLNTPVFIAALVSRRYAAHQCSPRWCAAACEARSPVWSWRPSRRLRARAAYSYGLSNLIYNHHPSTPVCGRLWPPPKIIFRPESTPEAGGRPLGSGHRPRYFSDFPRNSSGRFICMGDNDLTTKRPIRAQLGRFRFSRNSTQAIALHDLRAFRALFRGVIRI